jgi:hypothetical protein
MIRFFFVLLVQKTEIEWKSRIQIDSESDKKKTEKTTHTTQKKGGASLSVSLGIEQ